ncbi:FUSC family protein, partial [Corynebacterium sp.]|uniref:FUSC family protein n=1 Tax=Corynebacterium sp. TaxID=1720 RepID=UPI002605A8C9
MTVSGDNHRQDPPAAGENSADRIFGTDADSFGVRALPDAPSPPSMRAMLLTVKSFRAQIPRALRAALSILIPGFIGYALGFGSELLLVSAGAVLMINGENKPYRERWKSLLRYGLLFICLTLGFRLIGIWTHSHGVMNFHEGLSGVIANPKGAIIAYLPLLLFLAVCVICVYVTMCLRLTPPGPYLMLFVTGGLMVNEISISLTSTLVWSIVGAASGFIVSMSGWLVDKHAPERRAVEDAEAAVANYLEARDKEAAAEYESLKLTAAGAIHRAWSMLAHADAINGGAITPEARGTKGEQLVHRMLIAQQRWATADPHSHEQRTSPSDRRTIPLSSPGAWAKIKRQWHRDSHPVVTAQRVALAGLGVAIMSTVLGLGRPDWAITSVMLLLGQGPYRMAGTVRSIHRIAGSVIGILLYLAFYQLHPGILMDLIGLAVAMGCTELFIAANYGLAMVFTAPLGLMMAGLGSAPVGQTAMDRGAELVIGSLLSILSIWFFRPNNLQKTAELNYAHLLASIKRMIGSLRVNSIDDAVLDRRRLRYELNESRAVTSACANESFAWRRDQWDHHAAAQMVAHEVLRVGATAAHS